MSDQIKPLAEQPAQQHPDLSHLRPETQEAIRAWIKDGTFFDRAIGAMHDQEKRLMAYEKAQASKPLTDEEIFELASEHQDWDRNRIRVRSFARAIEAAHGIYAPTELKEKNA